MLSPYAIHHLKALIKEIVVSKYPYCLFYTLSPKGFQRISQTFLPFLAMTFEPKMSESQSNPLKTHTTTWFPIKFRVKKLALGIGAQGLIIFLK